MTESSLSCVAYDFSIDYDAIDAKEFWNRYFVALSSFLTKCKM